MPSFFDTNTLLYFAARDADKGDRIDSLLLQGGWISVQVLNEAARVMIGKWRYDWKAVHTVLVQFRTLLRVTDLDIETYALGLQVAQRYRIAIFDSMIVAAALHCGCDTLYSEDMHHGLIINDRLTITNPFAAP